MGEAVLYLAYTGQQLDTRGLLIRAQPELGIVISSDGKLKLPCGEMEGVRRACAQTDPAPLKCCLCASSW